MFAKIALLALPFTLLAAPAGAQSLSDTHETRWAVGGKTAPLVTHHPIKRKCASAAMHLSGKTPHMMAAPACGKDLAAAKPAHAVTQRN